MLICCLLKSLSLLELDCRGLVSAKMSTCTDSEYWPKFKGRIFCPRHLDTNGGFVSVWVSVMFCSLGYVLFSRVSGDMLNMFFWVVCFFPPYCRVLKWNWYSWYFLFDWLLVVCYLQILGFGLSLWVLCFLCHAKECLISHDEQWVK